MQVASYQELADKIVMMDVGGFSCRVLNLDTLIKAKEIARRNNDRSALIHLQALRQRNPSEK